MNISRYIAITAVAGIIAFALGAVTVRSACAADYSAPMGSGWYRHSWSDGTTGYSMPLGGGWYRHNLSDGTTGYSQPLWKPLPRQTWKRSKPQRAKNWLYQDPGFTGSWD